MTICARGEHSSRAQFAFYSDASAAARRVA